MQTGCAGALPVSPGAHATRTAASSAGTVHTAGGTAHASLGFNACGAAKSARFRLPLPVKTPVWTPASEGVKVPPVDNAFPPHELAPPPEEPAWGPSADRRGNTLNCLRKKGSHSEANSHICRHLLDNIPEGAMHHHR